MLQHEKVKGGQLMPWQPQPSGSAESLDEGEDKDPTDH